MHAHLSHWAGTERPCNASDERRPAYGSRQGPGEAAPARRPSLNQAPQEPGRRWLRVRSARRSTPRPRTDLRWRAGASRWGRGTRSCGHSAQPGSSVEPHRTSRDELPFHFSVAPLIPSTSAVPGPDGLLRRSTRRRQSRRFPGKRPYGRGQQAQRSCPGGSCLRRRLVNARPHASMGSTGRSASKPSSWPPVP